jgi:hypothetical protein
MMGLQVRPVKFLAMERKHIPTANKLSELSGVNYTMTKKIWSGDNTLKYVPIYALNAIADVLGVRAIDLLEQVEDEK